MIKTLIKHLGIIPEDEHYEIAELIVKECILTIQREIPRNDPTLENIRSRKHVQDIANKFGIKLPLDYYGIDYENTK